MKVLLATDGSNNAIDAGQLLAHLPHSKKLDLVIVSVVESHQLHGSREVIDWIQENQDAERQNAQAACDKIGAMFEGANVSVSTLICDGHAGERIVSQAKQHQAELIVVGAEGHSLLSRMLLGSVSDFVATHADCSVLIVRPSQKTNGQMEDINICLAHDDSESSRFARSQIEEFDWKQHTSIQVLSVLQFPFTYMNEPIEIDIQPLRDSLRESVEKTVASLSNVSPNVSAHLTEGLHVGDSIVKFAEKNAADIVVLGNTGLGLVGRLLLGSVANYVLRHTKCSIWIARERPAA